MTTRQRELAYTAGVIGMPKLRCDDESRWESGVAHQKMMLAKDVDVVKDVMGILVLEALVSEQAELMGLFSECLKISLEVEVEGRWETNATLAGRSTGSREIRLPRLGMGEDGRGGHRATEERTSRGNFTGSRSWGNDRLRRALVDGEQRPLATTRGVSMNLS